MLTHASQPLRMDFVAEQWSWMQWLSFRFYDWLPHFPIYNPDPLFLFNRMMSSPVLAWHSRYKTVFPHTLSYRMMRAIATDDIKQIYDLISNKKFNINASISEKYGYNAIQLATIINRYGTIQLLLLYGADINARSKHGDTPLMMAIDRKNYQAIHTLLKNGCDTKAVNKYGLSAMDKADGNKGILQFIQAYKNKPRQPPSVKFQNEVEQLLKNPAREMLLKQQVYANEPLQHPLQSTSFILTHSTTVEEILLREERKRKEKQSNGL